MERDETSPLPVADHVVAAVHSVQVRIGSADALEDIEIRSRLLKGVKEIRAEKIAHNDSEIRNPVERLTFPAGGNGKVKRRERAVFPGKAARVVAVVADDGERVVYAVHEGGRRARQVNLLELPRMMEQESVQMSIAGQECSCHVTAVIHAQHLSLGCAGNVDPGEFTVHDFEAVQFAAQKKTAIAAPDYEVPHNFTEIVDAACHSSVRRSRETEAHVSKFGRVDLTYGSACQRQTENGCDQNLAIHSGPPGPDISGEQYCPMLLLKRLVAQPEASAR